MAEYEPLFAQKLVRRNTEPPERRSTWKATASVLVAEMIGTGVLALGGSTRRLGLPLGVGLLVASYPINAYAMGLFAELHHHYEEHHDVNLTGIGELAAALYGPRGEAVCTVLGAVAQFFCAANYLLVVSFALQDMLYMFALCQPIASAIAALLLLFPAQLRTMHALTPLTVVSIATIVAVTGIIFAYIGQAAETLSEEAYTGKFGAAATSNAADDDSVAAAVLAAPPSEAPVFAVAGAVGAVIFSFGGQMIEFEFLSEMKAPVKDWPKAMHTSLVFIVAVYVAVAVTAVTMLGASTPAYLPDVLPVAPVRTFTNALLLVHASVSYLVYQQPVARRIHCAIDALAANATTASASASLRERGRVQWLAITAAFALAAYTLANAVTFFSSLVSIIGSSCSCLINLGLPPLFCMRKAHLCGETLPLGRRAACTVLLVFTAFMLTGGLGLQLVALVDTWSTLGPPFSCHCNGGWCGVSGRSA